MRSYIIPDEFLYDKNDIANYLLRPKTYSLLSEKVKGKKVLDVGCKNGYGSFIMKRSAVKVVGVDISSDEIKKAREAFVAEELEFLILDMDYKGNMPFQDDSFEVIVVFDVLEFIGENKKFFRELKRILVNEGVLIIATPNRTLRLLPFQNPWDSDHIKEFDYFEAENLVSRYFHDYQISGLTFSGMSLRRELGRITKLKIFLAPFSNVFLPDNIRRKMLLMIKNIRNKSILSFLFKKGSKKISERSIANIENQILITDDRKDKWLNLICFCINQK